MAEPHPQYWKVKAALLAKSLAQEQANTLVVRAHAELIKTMRDAGLDPEKDYVMADDGETISEKT